MSTDFFERQDQARRRTRMLVPLFLVAVVGTTAAVVAVVIVIANLVTLWAADWPADWEWTWWWPRVALGAGAAVLLIMLFAAAEKAHELRGGGPAIAQYLGGRPARMTDEPLDAGGLSERQLVNVVEEMAIAAGIPPPRVFVLGRERGINAFAAGARPDEATIAVTRGALAHLSRDELQAVVAHEFSHILNGDTRLNSRMILVVFGIGGIGMLGEGVVNAMFSVGDDDDGTGAAGLGHPIGWIILVLAIALAVAGSIGLSVARMLQVNVNRQREYLADASAVQFTRNPAGLAGALKKVGGMRHQGRLRSVHAAEVAHMCIAPPSLSLLETHPPLLDRILRLDPDFDGVFPKIVIVDVDTPHRLTATQNRVRAEFAQQRRTFQAQRRAGELLAGDVMSNIGLLSISAVAAASQILEDLPPRLREEAHDPAGAQAILLGLVPADDAEARRLQLEAAGEISLPIAARADELRQEMAGLSDEQRLPLLDLSLPAVQALAEHEKRRLIEVLGAAVRADDRLSLRELCFYKIIEHALLPGAPPRKPAYALAAVANQVAVLLSALAEMSDDPSLAYTVAINRLKLGHRSPPLAPPTAGEFEAALDELAGAGAGIIRRVLDAAAMCVATDGRISPEEHETLRAVAAALHVPMPPLAAAEAVKV